MLGRLPSEELTSVRREAAYRETALFLWLTGVALVATHAMDVIATGGPAWPALAVRLVTAAVLVTHARVIRRASNARVRTGGAIAIMVATVGYLLLVAVSGGAASPSIDLVYVFVVAMPLVSFELLPLGLLGSVVLVAGTGLIHLAAGSSGETLAAFVVGSLGALVAGLVLGRALLRARHAEEQRHQEVREALAANERLVEELREAMASVRTLTGLLPLCAWCRRVRSDSGYWEALEAYVTDHSDATITHGMCPDCARKHFPDADLDVGAERGTDVG